jgi:hypothetical protein
MKSRPFVGAVDEVSGDPLIRAFDGSLFFFHGEPQKVYNFLSVADDFQVSIDHDSACDQTSKISIHAFFTACNTFALDELPWCVNKNCVSIVQHVQSNMYVGFRQSHPFWISYKVP